VRNTLVNSLHIEAELSSRDFALSNKMLDVKGANLILTIGRQKERIVHGKPQDAFNGRT
jgi:hypothetical protein